MPLLWLWQMMTGTGRNKSVAEFGLLCMIWRMRMVVVGVQHGLASGREADRLGEIQRGGLVRRLPVRMVRDKTQQRPLHLANVVLLHVWRGLSGRTPSTCLGWMASEWRIGAQSGLTGTSG